MGKKVVSFVCNVQSKDHRTGRKILELPVNVRDGFEPGDTLKVKISKI